MKKHNHRMFLISILTIMVFTFFSSYAETVPAELHIMTNENFDVMDKYEKESNVSIVTKECNDTMMEEIANGFVTKNEDIDIYIFNAHDGLYYLKEKGYYYPLNSSPQLMDEYANLYPAFQKALTNHGDLVAWVMFAQPFVRSEDSNALAAYSVKSPVTFEDFLDTCRDLVAADAVGSGYSLMDVVTYDQKDMLDFYMKLYIMSCQEQYGVISFSGNGFAATVERIKNELPAETPDNTDDDENILSPVFCMMSAFEAITSSMLPMPTVLDGVPTAIETYMTVAVINPSSPRKEQALRFLEYCSKQRGPSTYFYNSAYSEPTENPTVVEQIQSVNEKIKTLEALAEQPSPAQRDELAFQKSCLSDLEKNRYMVTTDAIHYYANLAKSLYISEASPITYDEALQGLVSQYLNGLLDLQQFVASCQKHVDLISQE